MTKRLQPPLSLVPEVNRANAKRLGYVGRSPIDKPRDSDSWFTPPEYLDSVRTVMGSIDLDPFSSIKANDTVGAGRFFSLDNSAFENDWHVINGCRVFMNPPYSAGVCARAVNRFLEQYEAKRFIEGIVLVNNATDTRWFNALGKRCTSVCFTDHRISFWNSDGKHVSGNTRGQSFFYFGKKRAKFRKTFEKHGLVMVPVK